jgi:hypothetical protein
MEETLVLEAEDRDVLTKYTRDEVYAATLEYFKI